MTRLKAPRIKLTKTYIADIPTPVKTTAYYDTEVKRMYVRVTPTGGKTYILSVNINGQPDSLILGTFPTTSLENARKKAREYQYIIEQGGNPRLAKQLARAELTLGEYFAQYCANATKKTIADDKAYYRRYVHDHWDKRKLSAITTHEIRTRHKEVGTLNGKCAANHMLVMMRTIYNTAINDQIYKGINPTIGIKKYPTQSRDRFLSEQEMPYFFHALDLEENRQAATFYMLLLLVGQRKSNTLAMRWEQIDFNSSDWRIPHPKNGIPHRAVLPAEALALLREIKQSNVTQHLASPWVFPSLDSASGYMGEPRKSWARILKRAELLHLVDMLASKQGWSTQEIREKKETPAHKVNEVLAALKIIAVNAKIDLSGLGIANFRIHDLRRTNGSWLALEGASSFIIGKALGHQSHASTAVYARLPSDAQREYSNKAIQRMLATRTAVSAVVSNNVEISYIPPTGH